MSPNPDAQDPLAKALSLLALGQREAAHFECLAALKLDPGRPEALLLHARILRDMGRRESAIEAYLRAVEATPDSLEAQVNLGDLYWQEHQPEAARVHLEAALLRDPDCAEAHQGMAKVLADLREPEAARAHSLKAYKGNPMQVLPYDGPHGEAVEVLVLCAWQAANTPLDHALDRRLFRQTKINVEFHQGPLPFHHLVWNAIGDVEIPGVNEALDRCEALLRTTRAPLLNPPLRIRPTGRADNARRLSGIPGLIVPKIMNFKREVLLGVGGADALENAAFRFPLLVRATGFQGGLDFAKVDTAEGLAAAVESFESKGEDLAVLEFMDARAEDGKIRKYRAMMVGGRLFPLHAAVSPQWKIHYFSAGMRDNPEHRAEDKAFLDDMPAVLGEKAMTALGRVQAALGLDYGGIDFSLSPKGDVIFFESNATMVVPRPDSAQVWDYRRAPVQKILDAVSAMLFARLGRSLPKRVQGPATAQAPVGSPDLARAASGPALHLGASGPSELDQRLARAWGMHKFGMLKEAKREYATILAGNPDHGETLAKYAALMLEEGRAAAAAQVYARLLELQPKRAEAHAGLGRALLSQNQGVLARARFETALELDPGSNAAHQGLAELYGAARDLPRAREHGRKAFGGKSYYELPFRGSGSAPRVLALYSALGGNVALAQTLDPRGFHHVALVAEYHEAGELLPDHDVLFNAIGDADLSPLALETALKLSKLSKAPLLNPPQGVARASTARFGEILAGIPGLETLPPEEPGQKKPQTSGQEGRHCQVLGLGRRLYPLWAGSAPAGTLNAEAPGQAGAKAADEAFLKDMPTQLGPVALKALQAAQEALNLDYVVLDFFLRADGGVNLAQAKPGLALLAQNPGAAEDYRSAAWAKTTEAVNDLLRSRLSMLH